jgi:pterin-4a-carbinolamine dehydratase
VARRIFINYRRSDSEAEAGRLVDTLRQKLDDAAVFLDASSLDIGTDWPTSIREELNRCTDIIILIGAEWLRVGADAFGRRRIDDPQDWVRQEIELALAEGKHVIPVLLHQAKMPPAEVLPPSIQRLTSLHALEIRSEYWNHDIKLLIKQLQLPLSVTADGAADSDLGPYPPKPTIETVLPVSDEQLRLALDGPLKSWEVYASASPEEPSVIRMELFRAYKFHEFKDVISFMSMVAAGCDIANHHPRWENIWRTLRVYLTTWNIDHKISDRDVQLAKYFDSSYRDFMKSRPKARDD